MADLSDDLLTIGRWVERERKARHWSRPRLALEAGISENTVYLLEVGANTRTSSLLRVIAALEARLVLRYPTDSVPPA
jgi:transcriptional regulator with XRE-family HTH domain